MDQNENSASLYIPTDKNIVNNKKKQSFNIGQFKKFATYSFTNRKFVYACCKVYL